jgi:hypothetical protein
MLHQVESATHWWVGQHGVTNPGYQHSQLKLDGWIGHQTPSTTS